MLRETKAWTVTCDRCGSEQALEATSLTEAAAAATRAGWMDQARKGKPLEQRTWLCPKCRPTAAPPDRMGRTT